MIRYYNQPGRGGLHGIASYCLSNKQINRQTSIQAFVATHCSLRRGAPAAKAPSILSQSRGAAQGAGFLGRARRDLPRPSQRHDRRHSCGSAYACRPILGGRHVLGHGPRFPHRAPPCGSDGEVYSQGWAFREGGTLASTEQGRFHLENDGRQEVRLRLLGLPLGGPPCCA